MVLPNDQIGIQTDLDGALAVLNVKHLGGIDGQRLQCLQFIQTVANAQLCIGGEIIQR